MSFSDLDESSLKLSSQESTFTESLPIDDTCSYYESSMLSWEEDGVLSSNDALLTSTYDAQTSDCSYIEAKLPNGLLSLTNSTIAAILVTAPTSEPRALPFICRKLHRVHEDFTMDSNTFIRTTYTSQTITAIRHRHRLFMTHPTHPTRPPMPTPANPTPTIPRRVRLPYIVQFAVGNACWFALTRSGLYIWGQNSFGELGLGHRRPVKRPTRHNIDNISQIVAFDNSTFFEIDSKWKACGHNASGQLGIGLTQPYVLGPVPVKHSDTVTRWTMSGQVTFAWTPGWLMACGSNRFGETGTGSCESSVTTLTPVILPDGVKGRVDRVVSNDGSTFIISNGQLFAFGSNRRHQLPVHQAFIKSKPLVKFPIEISGIPVSDVITSCSTTVFVSNSVVFACGDNSGRKICDRADPTIGLLQVSLPWPVASISLIGNKLFAWTSYGEVFCRGGNELSFDEFGSLDEDSADSDSGTYNPRPPPSSGDAWTRVQSTPDVAALGCCVIVLTPPGRPQPEQFISVPTPAAVVLGGAGSEADNVRLSTARSYSVVDRGGWGSDEDEVEERLTVDLSEMDFSGLGLG